MMPTSLVAPLKSWLSCVALLLPHILPCAQGFGEAPRFLIVSAPSTHRIAYVKIPYGGLDASREQLQMLTLIKDGLYVPQGIAVDQYRKKLFVADPDLGKLVAYDLITRGDKLEVGPQQTVANSVEVRWVSVDGLGNVFFSDEPRNRIMKVTAEMMENGITTAQTVYDGSTVSLVSVPVGIAVDNYFVLWLNKASGTQVGSLMQAKQVSSTSSIKRLAGNAMKSYGVCIALGNIFFTDELTNLYGVKRGGSAVTTVSSGFAEPRGCGFDGEGTVYVADKRNNAVYSFASNMQELASDTPLTKAVDLQGAFGVAVYIKVL